MSLLSHNMHDPESIPRFHMRGTVRSTLTYDSPPPSSPDSTCSPSPATPTDRSPLISSANYPCTDTGASSPSHTVVSIDVLPSGVPWSPSQQPPDSSSSSVSYQQNHNTQSNGGGSSCTNISSDNNIHTFRPSTQPRPLWAIDPTVTFISRSSMSAASFVSVFFDSDVVHTHASLLEVVRNGPPETEGSLLYSTTLAPAYWKFICNSDGS
jgi:hypothetical protein